MSISQVVLHTTALRLDWSLMGFRKQLLATRVWRGSLTVNFPTSVPEELIGHHERESGVAAEGRVEAVRAISRLGLCTSIGEFDSLD